MTDTRQCIDEDPSESQSSEGGVIPRWSMSPGIGIVSSWQGVVEIGLRALSLILPILTFLTAAVAVGQINELNGDFKDTIDDSSEHHRSDSRVPDTPELVTLSRADGGFLIFMAFVVVFYEVFVIVLRFLNVSVVNQNVVTLLVVDVTMTSALAFIYLVTGAVAGHYSTQWDEWVDYTDLFPEEVRRILDPDNLKTIRNSLGATAAFCILEMAVYIGVATWIVVSLILKWQQRVISTGTNDQYSSLS